MRAVFSIATLCLLATASFAQTSVDRAFEPSPRDCSDVRWSQQTLEAIPRIAGACRAVEQRNGKSYVKLSGKVQDVVTGGRRVIVDFDHGGSLAFTPSPHTKLYLDGERTDFADLRPGTELNFYIPEDRLQAELQPDIQRAFFILLPLEVQPAQRMAADARTPGQLPRPGALTPAALPTTASMWPALALIGVSLLLLAVGLTLYSRRALRPPSQPSQVH